MKTGVAGTVIAITIIMALATIITGVIVIVAGRLKGLVMFG